MRLRGEAYHIAVTDAHTEPLFIELPEPLPRAVELMRRAGGRCRLVGGSVRDALRGIAPKDFDIEVFGLELEEIAQLLSRLGKTNLVGRSFCVVKLRSHGAEFDFSIPRREAKAGTGHRGFAVEADAQMSERQALSRRDFTINALMYDPEERRLIDPFNGKRDLQAGILRHVGPAFSEDPLRALRALQFAARFDLQLHPDTAALCRRMKKEYWTLPRERIWGEWRKWAAQSAKPSRGLQALSESGWAQFYPELNLLQRLPQDPAWHPEGDVWTHTLRCVDALAAQEDWEALDAEARQLRLFGTLCHDLGKSPCTRFALKRGALHWISPGHDKAGVPLTEAFLRRIGAPKPLIESVPKLVANHHVLNSAPVEGMSDSSLRRLARRLEPASLADLVAVMRADHLGRPPFVSEVQEAKIARLEEQIRELELAEAAPEPILMGRHLIERGWKPGPSIGEALDEAFEAQLDGAFEDLAGALAWLDKRER